MTSLVTTLTLMMAFNAIVFNGVTTVWAVDDTECKTKTNEIGRCLQSKWILTSVDKTSEVKTLMFCCLNFNSICVTNQLVREEVCKRTQEMGKDMKSVEDMCHQYIDVCSQQKTSAMGVSCDPYKKYTNCSHTIDPIRFKDLKCGQITGKLTECLMSKWNQSFEVLESDVMTLEECCFGFNTVCVGDQLIREDVCKRSQEMGKEMKNFEQKCNQYKDCSQVKTYAMDETCNEYKNYTNCELKNRSHHISCGPLLVITSIAIVIVIQLFS